MQKRYRIAAASKTEVCSFNDPRTKTFRKPTVIVGGSRDQFFADAMVEVRVRGAGIKTAIFEGETHMVPIERARAVKQIVSDFFGSG